MAELILNQYTRDIDLWKLEDKQIISVFTQSMFSMSNLHPKNCLVRAVERSIGNTFLITFDNDFEYTVENGKVIYHD